MAKPKFAHVVYQTSQKEAMIDFYTTLLEGEVVFTDDTLSFISFDEEHHRVALIHPPEQMDRKTEKTAAMHHSAYTFDNLDDLLERYESVRDKGLRLRCASRTASPPRCTTRTPTATSSRCRSTASRIPTTPRPT